MRSRSTPTSTRSRNLRWRITSGLQTHPIARPHLTPTDRICMTEPKSAFSPDVSRHGSTEVRSHRARTAAAQVGNDTCSSSRCRRAGRASCLAQGEFRRLIEAERLTCRPDFGEPVAELLAGPRFRPLNERSLVPLEEVPALFAQAGRDSEQPRCPLRLPRCESDCGQSLERSARVTHRTEL